MTPAGMVPYEEPRVLPPAWTRKGLVPHSLGRQTLYVRSCGLRVILSVDTNDQGSEWLHISFSRSYRLPSWSDLREVKDLFFGDDRMAVQILPRASQYVNFHPHTLHLWSRLDGPTLAATHPEES